MSSKLLIASAIMAAGSFMFVDAADAQRRGGAERGGNGSVEAGERRRGARQGRRDGTRQARNNSNRAEQMRSKKRNAKRNKSKTKKQKAKRAQKRKAPRVAAKSERYFYHRDGLWSHRNPVARGWRKAHRWAAHRWANRPYFNDNVCTAVARRGGGNGRIIRGVYGEGYGRRACRKALNRCEDRLYDRQARGRNPYAACVIASR